MLHEPIDTDDPPSSPPPTIDDREEEEEEEWAIPSTSREHISPRHNSSSSPLTRGCNGSKVPLKDSLNATNVLFDIENDNTSSSSHDASDRGDTAKRPRTYSSPHSTRPSSSKRSRLVSSSSSTSSTSSSPSSSDTSSPSTPRLSSSPRFRALFQPYDILSRTSKRSASPTPPKIKFKRNSQELEASPTIFSASKNTDKDNDKDKDKPQGKPSKGPVIPAHSAFKPKLVYPGGRHVKVHPRKMILTGETIMTSPLAYTALHSSLLKTHCSGCLLRPAEQFARLSPEERDIPGAEKAVSKRYKKCSRCRAVVYCSLKCYAKNSAAHFPECRALSRCDEPPDAEARLLAKVFHAKSMGKHMDIPDWITATRGDCIPVAMGSIIDDLTRFLRKTHKGRTRIDWKEYGMSGLDEVEDLVRKLRMMIFPLKDGHDRPLGYCLANAPSQISHSCTPNAFVSFPEGADTTEPMKTISLDAKWGDDEITISYVDQKVPCHVRGETLSLSGFDHECEYCQKVSERGDIRWSAKHRNCLRKGTLPLSDGTKGLTRPCTGCDLKAYISDFEVRSAVVDVEKWYEARKYNLRLIPTEPRNYAEEIEVLSELLTTLGDDYPESLYMLPHIRHRFGTMVILSTTSTMQDLESAVVQLAEAYQGYRIAFDDQPRPITVELLLLTCSAELKICRRYEQELNKVERKARRKALTGIGKWRGRHLSSSVRLLPPAIIEERKSRGRWERNAMAATDMSDTDTMESEDETDLDLDTKPGTPLGRRKAEDIKSKMLEALERAGGLLERARSEHAEIGGDTLGKRSEINRELSLLDEE